MSMPLWNYTKPCPDRLKARFNPASPMRVGWQPFQRVTVTLQQAEELVELCQWTGMHYEWVEVGFTDIQMTLWGCSFAIRDQLLSKLLTCQVCQSPAEVYLQWREGSRSVCCGCEPGVIDSLQQRRKHLFYARIAA